MLLKLLLTIASIFTSPFRGPVDPDKPYEATPYGPQNWEDAILARQALQGENDDILDFEDDEPSYAGINGTQYRWPGYPGAGTIPYVLDAAVQRDQNLVKLINDAIKQYETNTCIRFVKRKNEQNYVKIIKDDGKCYSVVGLKTRYRQPQPLSLGGGCEYIGTVVHELGHAIGLFHEHQRSDRDSFINVYDQNIQAGMSRNFNKTDPIDELKWAIYDYTSIMHYGEYAFSKQPGKLKTMEANDGKTKLLEPYDRPGLNQNDIDLVKKLYKCK
ncbi:unnamed protein product [Larinioides sclopetarius]|uniref:Metalloendopeptidase n=1 Tax=Larinioides sclopetarius TaxID=280406 RepID=A0AAV1Z4Y1_9ARAC